MAEFTIALAGNPNTGKSTIFNALTGANQHTGNWPGKTVAKKEGLWEWKGQRYRLVDLPGAYSLSAYSLEETITRDYIVRERPDLVVVVTDATNLERNLYLVVQIREITGRVLVVLNMQDVLQAHGQHIDSDYLAEQLGVPVIPTAARQGEGLSALKEAIARELTAKPQPSSAPAFAIDYGPLVEQHLANLQTIIAANARLSASFPPRWLALQLLAGDKSSEQELEDNAGADDLLSQAQAARQTLQQQLPLDIDTWIADHRYTWIHQLVQQVVQQPAAPRPSLTDRLDRIATHPLGGLLLFFFMMWLVFKLSTDVAAPYVDWIDGVINGPFTALVHASLTLLNLDGTWLARFLTDGLLAGIGGVLVFIPVLMFLYLGLALLEDSGYMARAAFVMDRHMQRLGLGGKSFVPLVLGFGCNVPAVYATRTLENERDRKLTGLLIPFMSCGARLPVYVLIASIFFPRHRSLIILSLYALGILFALLTGLALRHTIFRRKTEAGLLMELPAYHLPAPGNVWREMWLRTRGFLQGAARMIIIVSMFIWLLTAIPVRGEASFAQTDIDDSAFAALAGGLAPVFKPLGFGNWQSAGALLSGLVAKEVIISTSAQIYHLDTGTAQAHVSPWEAGVTIITDFGRATWDTVLALPSLAGLSLQGDNPQPEIPGLAQAMRQQFAETSGNYATLAALAFMVFVLLYTPCAATIAAQRQEFGGRWAAASVALQLTVAWLTAFLVFHGGQWLWPGGLT